jgi:hypothetical protein
MRHQAIVLSVAVVAGMAGGGGMWALRSGNI